MRRVLLVLVLCGCRNVLGISSETSVETHQLGGTAAGVVGASSSPVTVTVDIDGMPPRTLTLTADGMFTFGAVPNESGYQVTTSAGCLVVAGASDLIQGLDKNDIVVECDGAFALAEFGFSAPLDTTPRLSGAVLTYQTFGSFLTKKTRLVPRALVTGTTAHGFYGATMASPSTVFDTVTGQSIRVEMSRDSAAVMRTYATVLDLTGAPTQFGYGKRDQSSDGDRFGSVIAAVESGLVVGLPARDEAIVFARSGRSWIQIAKLTGPAGSEFGSSIAMSGTSIFVGAPATSTVYEFRTSSGTAFPQVDMISKAAGSRFGSALAANDSNLYVGASLSAATGQVFVYTRGPSLTEATATSPLVTPIGTQRFGEALALNATTLVVGAPGDDHGGGLVDAGMAYRFPLASLNAPISMRATPPGAGDQFGAAVAIDAASQPTIAISAPFEDSGSSADPLDDTRSTAGAVYVFRPSGPPEYLKAPVPDTGDAFGWSLSIQGTLLAVGAPFEDSAALGVGGSPSNEAAPDAGAAFVYDFTKVDGTGKLLPPTYIKASNTDAGDQFGTCVALTEDSLVVSAPGEDSSSTGWNSFENGGDPDDERGAVYTFR